MRYVGDMLAWVHQSIAAEREFLESLFGIKSDGRMVGSVRKFEDNENEEWVKELMDAAMGKLCVPLKVIIIQKFHQGRSFLSFSFFHRFACSKRFGLKRVVSCPSRLQIYSSFIC